MKLFILGSWAFADLGRGYLICIGTTQDVENANLVKVAEMVLESLATSDYRSIEKSPKVLH